MVERRPLVEGLNPVPAVDLQRETEFVYGGATKKGSEPTASQSSTGLSRAPLSTRIRSDFAAALKRASLERQLNGVEPSTLQDILEQAIEPWLKSNGYIR